MPKNQISPHQGVGLCPMEIRGVLVTLHMFRFTHRSHHVPSGWMVCISGSNHLGGRWMVALCGLCGFSVWDIIHGNAHYNSQEVPLMYKWQMWLSLVRYILICRFDEANKPSIWIGSVVSCLTDVNHVIFVCLTELPDRDLWVGGDTLV